MQGMSTPPQPATQPSHHAAVLAQQPVTMWAPADVVVDFLGTKTRRTYEAGMPGQRQCAGVAEVVTPAYPSFDEEYFEWVDILEAVEEAADSFVMMELGAGFGRWSMRAASAVRRKPGCRFHGVAVEAEPNHFRWLLDHFRHNGFDPVEHELIWAAIGAQAGFVPFWTGDPASWYGQSVPVAPREALPDAGARRRLKARSALGRPPVATQENREVIWVPSVSLIELVTPYPHVDLIDIDVQGRELQVLEPAIDLLNERVRRIHIGTHSAQIEEALRQLFSDAGWEKLNDYPCQSSVPTPYGDMTFGDGVQTWRNPFRESSRQSSGMVQGTARSSAGSPELVAALRARVADLSERNSQLVAQAERRSAHSPEVTASLRARVAELKEQNRQLKAEMARRSTEPPEVVAALRARVAEQKERNQELKAEAVRLREVHRSRPYPPKAARWWKRLVPGWLARLRRRFG